MTYHIANIEPNAVTRLMQMRAEAVRQEYEAFAGVDRGVRIFYDWTRRKWRRGRIIDIGCRPDTRREALAHEQPQGSSDTPDVTAADVRRFFARRDNQPATTIDIAEELGCTQNVAYRLLSDESAYTRVYKGAGATANIYVPVGYEQNASPVMLIPAAHRAIYEVIMEAGGELTLPEIKRRTGITDRTIRNARDRNTHIFGHDVRVVRYDKANVRTSVIWIRPEFQATNTQEVNR